MIIQAHLYARAQFRSPAAHGLAAAEIHLFRPVPPSTADQQCSSQLVFVHRATPPHYPKASQLSPMLHQARHLYSVIVLFPTTVISDCIVPSRDAKAKFVLIQMQPGEIERQSQQTSKGLASSRCDS